MRQEYLFCAEVYHRLHQSIDHNRPRFLCLDGQAAQKGVVDGLFLDSDVPDFYFHFTGGTAPFLMEAKIVDVGKIKFGSPSQCKAWAPDGKGHYLPLLWIGATEDFTRFFLWEHASFLEALARGPNAQGLLRIPDSTTVQEYADLDELVAGILKYARSSGHLPREVKRG